MVWTWVITKPPGPVKGARYFLYTIIDIYGRWIVGWSVAEGKSETDARTLIREARWRQGVERAVFH
ncbi:MAG: hypothetical protein ACYDEY_13805 [Acidimicrobiales bacterium]